MKGTIVKRGKSSWRLKYDLPPGPDGKRRTVYETVRAATKKDAQTKLTERLAAIGRSEHVEPSKVTVAAYVATRIEHWRNSGVIGAKATKRYQVLLARQIEPFIGAIALQKLSTTDVETWHKRLKDSDLAHGTIKMAHKVMKQAIDDAQRHSQVTRNVCALQKVPKAPGKQAVTFKAGEIGDVLKKLKGTAIYEKALLGLFCGLRAGEILALRWSSVELDKGLLHVREATEEVMGQPVVIKAPKTKAGKRTITMPAAAVDALRDHRRKQLELRLALGQGRPSGDELVFPAQSGGPAGTANLSKQWRRTVKALGLPDVNFHATRHYHASALLKAKIDLATIASRLGHSNAAVTLKTYSHMIDQDDAAAAAAVDAALGAIPVPKSG